MRLRREIARFREMFFPRRQQVRIASVEGLLQQSAPKLTVRPDSEFYEIRSVPGKGYGCFAVRDIPRGTRILADSPLIVVPVAEYLLSDIQPVFDKLSLEDQALYFTLHSAHGQDPAKWPKKIHESVPSQERRRIEEQHAARTGNKATIISIFQTNCMEMDNGAAIFPNAARFNHRCNPNACFTWNPLIGRETIHSIRNIAADEEITLSYCDMNHDKATRRWELKHYGFECNCAACVNDNDPDSFAALSAQRRIRLMELDKEFQRTRWRYLEVGAKEPGFVEKLLEYAKLLNEEGDYTIKLANTYLDIGLVCEQYSDFKKAYSCALKALKVVMDSLGKDSPEYPKYKAVVRRLKKKARA
jgi:hypothetical protein